MTTDEMTVGAMTVDKMRVNEMTVDKMSVDEMPIDEMTRCLLLYSNVTIRSMPVFTTFT